MTVVWQGMKKLTIPSRVVAHTALYDFRGDERRHNVRLAAMSDVPKEPWE